MYLSKIKTEKNITVTQRNIEKFADDLMMISINNDVSDNLGVYSYWRLMGTGSIPPLEIGINTDKRYIKNLTFFIKSTFFKDFKYCIKTISEGSIIVDTEIFTKKNDYVDIEGNYWVMLESDKLICFFNEQFDIEELVTNNHIDFFLNKEYKLQGFAINNLNEHDIKNIKSLLEKSH